MESPLLSIIIPVYNVEAYVRNTLQSVFNTTANTADFEVIIVNDGTQDNSMAIVQEFSSRSNLIIVEQENQGLSAARMLGVSTSKGQFLWFIDSDDWLVDNGIEIVLDLLQKKSYADVLMFPLIRLSEDKNKSSIDYTLDNPFLISGRQLIREGKYPLYSSVRYVFRRELMNKSMVFFPTGLIHEDEYFAPALLYHAMDVQIEKEPVYIHIQRPGSIMTSRTIRSAYDIVAIHKLLMQYSDSIVTQEDRHWFNSYCWALLHNLYRRDAPFAATKEFRLFTHKKGFYIWRQWRHIYPHESIRRNIGRLIHFIHS